MRSKEGQSLTNAGEHDIRMTAAQWVERIEKIDSPAMLMTIAESLSEGHMLREDNEENGEVKPRMTSSRLVEIALTKYMEVSGAGSVELMEAIVNSVEKDKRDNPSSPRDLLALKCDAIDLIIKRKKIREIQELFLYLNAKRTFISFELLKMKLAEIRQTMKEFEDTQKMRMEFGDSVSGVIETGETK